MSRPRFRATAPAPPARGLAALVGATILDVQSCQWQPGALPVTVLVVRSPAGAVYQAEVWRDAEGNGPGWLDVEPVR